MNQNKIMKTAKRIENILSLVKDILILLVAITIIAAILFEFGIINLNNGISFGNITLFIADDLLETPIYDKKVFKFLYEISIILGLINTILVIYGIKVILNFVTPMKEGKTPFQESISAKLRLLSWLILADGIFNAIVNFYIDIKKMQAVSWNNLLDLSVISNYSTSSNFNFDLKYLICACAIFILSYVFSYGELLQKESDETL